MIVEASKITDFQRLERRGALPERQQLETDRVFGQNAEANPSGWKQEPPERLIPFRGLTAKTPML